MVTLLLYHSRVFYKGFLEPLIITIMFRRSNNDSQGGICDYFESTVAFASEKALIITSQSVGINSCPVPSKVSRYEFFNFLARNGACR